MEYVEIPVNISGTGLIDADVLDKTESGMWLVILILFGRTNQQGPCFKKCCACAHHRTPSVTVDLGHFARKCDNLVFELENPLPNLNYGFFVGIQAITPKCLMRAQRTRERVIGTIDTPGIKAR
jgi:hypothetical protein